MRDTATVEYVDYFQVLGIGRRITWIDLWNKIEETASWEASVSLPFHVNAISADVILTRKSDDTKLSSYKIPVKNIIDKDGDLDETSLAYELIKLVKKNKMFNKKRTDKDQSILDELRKKRNNLSVRIYNRKSQGKDATELLKEMDSLKEQIKKFK